MKKNSKFVRIICFTLALLFTFTSIPVYADGEEQKVTLSPYQGDSAEQFRSSFSYYDDVEAMLIGEPTTGKILIEKNSEKPLGIASMTKLMTYYLVKKDIAEGKIDPKQTVKISSSAAEFNVAGSSNYGLKAGETRTVEQLLMGMMVVSGNDAAAMLGEILAGSEQACAERMNQEAAALGMRNTHFVNASGFTVNGQYNTASARDMFILAFALLKDFPEVRELAAIKTINEPERQYSGRSTLTEATVDIPGLEGLKTGVTEEAGYCFTGALSLTSSADSIPFEAISVVMGAGSNDSRWRTTKELADLAAGSFSHISLVDAAKPVKRYEMPSAEEESVVLYPASSYSVFTYSHQTFSIRYQFDENKKAPTAAEEKFGEILIYQNGEMIKMIDIVAHKPTTKAGLWTRIKRATKDFAHFVLHLL